MLASRPFMRPFFARQLQLVRSLATAFWQGPWQARCYRVLMAASLAFGVALRLVGQVSGRPSLWFDEALWASRLVREPLLEMRIRPIGFTWPVKQLVNLFGATEFWLRFIPNVASIVALLFIPYVASQLLKSRPARLLLVFSFALHPALIDFSKEFKPYSFEVLVQLVPILLYLRYRQTKLRGYLYAFLGVLPLLFVFAYNMVFAYPGLLLLALFSGWRERRWRGLVAPALSGVACLAVVAGAYALLLRGIASERKENYWGRKYDVFYQPQLKGQNKQSQVDWLVEKYDDVAALPGLRRELWRAPRISEGVRAELGSADRLFWIALHLLGVYYLASRRRWAELLLFVVPVLTMMVVNVLGKWPMGAFRTNLFFCVHALPMAALGADFLIRRGRATAWTVGALVMVLNVLPGFAFGFEWHRYKRIWTRDHQERELLERLRAHREAHLKLDPKRPKEKLLLDPHTADSHKFYVRIHPEVSARQRRFFQENFVTEYEAGSEQSMNRRLSKRLASESQPVWVVVSKPSDMAPVRDYASRAGQIVVEERLRNNHLILLVGKKR